jgi:hypothetical protein
MKNLNNIAFTFSWEGSGTDSEGYESFSHSGIITKDGKFIPHGINGNFEKWNGCAYYGYKEQSINNKVEHKLDISEEQLSKFPHISGGSVVPYSKEYNLLLKAGIPSCEKVCAYGGSDIHTLWEGNLLTRYRHSSGIWIETWKVYKDEYEDENYNIVINWDVTYFWFKNQDDTQPFKKCKHLPTNNRQINKNVKFILHKIRM